MFDPVLDRNVRLATFGWLGEQVSLHGDVLPRAVLADGFRFDGVRVPLLGPQGIFKPKILDEAPLSITTAPNSPYDDSFNSEGLLRYRYRGTNPAHVDNRGLRFAMERRLPLVYMHGVVPGRYLVAWPVLVVRDDPQTLAFTVAVDDAGHLALPETMATDGSDVIRRAYATAVVRVRLHQRAFRERVLEAYSRQCSFCRLRHEELLDAAHIIPDAEAAGDPHVTNGISLCSLHHAAFDRYFIGVRPDCTIEIREDLRAERDGPTLAHAIQALHGSPIILPKRLALRPARALLEQRYERFRRASHLTAK